MVQESDPLKSFEQPSAPFGRIKDVPSTSSFENAGSSGSRRTPEEIRADMRRTRAEIDQTVDDLQDHLRPSAIASRVAHSAQHVAGSVALRALNAIKENPLPATVIGAGLLMMLTRRHGADRTSRWPSGQEATVRPDSLYRGPSTFERTREAVSQTLSTAKDKAGEITHTAAEKVKDAAGTIGEKLHDASAATSRTVRDVSTTAVEKASRFGHQVGDTAKHSAQWVDEMVHEYPLAAGAACFAIGLAGGFALPASQKENELVGPARDRMMRQARAMGTDLIQKGEEVAERAVGAVGTVVKEKAETIKEKAESVSRTTKAASESSSISSSATTSSAASRGASGSPTASNPRRWEDTNRRGPT